MNLTFTGISKNNKEFIRRSECVLPSFNKITKPVDLTSTCWPDGFNLVVSCLTWFKLMFKSVSYHFQTSLESSGNLKVLDPHTHVHTHSTIFTLLLLILLIAKISKFPLNHCSGKIFLEFLVFLQTRLFTDINNAPNYASLVR